MTDTLIAPTVAPPDAAGYRSTPRYRTIQAAPGSLWDGVSTESDPLTATVRSNLKGGELDQLKWARDRAFETGVDTELFAVLAPYVVGWNCQRSVFDPETGEVRWEPLPPPAEAGPDVFAEVDNLTVVFLVAQVIRTPTTLSDSAAKTSTPSDGRRDGEDSETPPGSSDAPSPTPNRSSRKTRQTSSPTPAAST